MRASLFWAGVAPPLVATATAALAAVVGTVAAAAAAAADAGPSTIAFPPPPPGAPTVGRFHTLPALPSRRHPPPAGGTSPDADAVAVPGSSGGGTGWVLAVNMCASPLSDAAQLEWLADADRTWGLAPGPGEPRAPTTVPGGSGRGVGRDREFEWAGNYKAARMAQWAMRSIPVGSVVSAESFRPHPCARPGAAAATAGSGLVCEEEVMRLMALHRNSWLGTVARHRGVYDVLAVVRATVGIAQDWHGRVVAAQERVADGATWDNRQTTLVTYTSADGITRPVLAGGAALLSLGRGMVADPTWLSPSIPGGIFGRVELQVVRGGVYKRRGWWSLRPGGPDTAPSHAWLQEMARAVCQPPVASLVTASGVGGGLCDGVEPPPRSSLRSVLAGGRQVADAVGP